MFRRAGHAANQVTDPLEIEAALDFPMNNFADQSRLAPFLGSCAPSQRLALRFRKTDGKSGFHAERLRDVRQNARQDEERKGRVANDKHGWPSGVWDIENVQFRSGQRERVSDSKKSSEGSRIFRQRNGGTLSGK